MSEAREPTYFSQGPMGLPPSVLCATLLVMAAFAASRFAILGEASEREYDEGVYLLSARSLLAGHPLFTSVFSSQPPAFLETLAAAMRLAGDRLETARMLILGFSLLSLAAIADRRRRRQPWRCRVASATSATWCRPRPLPWPWPCSRSAPPSTLATGTGTGAGSPPPAA
jgi:hypothetical protein